jgi:PHD/YefM family antitoxin component YafN of YafNO toxin-antitoxin module
MSQASFQTLDVGVARESLENLTERVIRDHGRVVITRDATASSDADACVLISKAELDGLERALEILSETESGAAMRDELLRVAARASSPVPASATSVSSIS